MAPRHTTLTIPAGTPFPISDGAVAAIRINNRSSYETLIQCTLTDTAPAADGLGAQTLKSGATLSADLALVDLFPGVGAGPFFVWNISANQITLSVSHA